MTYTEAVRMALSGDDRGYTYLYEETYRSKLYLAIQYMKNEDDAMDVLQDAYVKAFAKLDTLQDPEKFPSWFGMIVANTAKNALVKKNPVLFTDMSTDPDAEPFEYSIEDEDISHQPELSYTSEETRLLVREMMDALSEEQRVCVLMFHIDGIPIKEIAETLGCSENTVKSRLNYARKNIKKQGEELQKKGYQLYEIAPFTLLLLLLHKDASAMSGEAEFLAAGEKVEQAVFQNGSSFAGEGAASSIMEDVAGEGASAGTGAASSAAGNAAAGTAAKTAAGAAVKSAFLSTVAGKITIGVIGAVLIGGAAFGVSQVVQNNQDRSTSAVVQEADGTGTLSSESVPETVAGVEVETESELETEWETMFETELLPAETESETELAAETESETETETERETEIETETIEIETELETETETEIESKSETETESETVVETEIESESETETETESEIQTEAVTETESETEIESESESESETETIAETESEDTAVVQAVSFDEFPDLLEGNLTKEELEFVYAYYSDYSTDYSIDEQHFYQLESFCNASINGADILTYMGEKTISIIYENGTGYGTYEGFLVDELNRLLSICMDFQLTEDYSFSFYENFPEAFVEGDTLWMRPVGMSTLKFVDITEAFIIDDELILNCDISYSSSEIQPYSATFTLQKNDNGKFQFARSVSSDIESGTVISEETETNETETESETETEVSVRQVSDDEYADLLEGSLTKEELEYMLAYTAEGYVSNRDSMGYYNYLYGFCWRDNSPLEILEFDGGSCYALSVDEVNRLISVITDFRLTEENDIDYDNYGSENVDGDIVWVTPCAFDYAATAEVYAAGVADNYMAIAFSYHHYSGDADDSTDTFQEDVNENRIAILQKKEDGRFQIEYIGTIDMTYLQYPDLKDFIDTLVISIENSDTSVAEKEDEVEVPMETESETQTELLTESQTEAETEQVLVIGADMETESKAETESADSAAVQTVADDEYPELLEGALTKEELEFVLTYGPEKLTEAGLTDTEYTYILNQFGQGSRNVAHLLTEMGYDANYRAGYLVDEINRLFSVFTDYRFTEENDTDSEYGIDVDGDTIWYSPAELGWDYSAEITEAVCTEDKMILYYDYVKSGSPDPDVVDIYENKAAVLEKNANGNFQIVLITDAASVSTDELYTVSETEAEAGSEEMVIIIGEDTGSTADAGMTEEIRALYEQVLQDVADGKYSFPSVEGCSIEGYYYFVTDMDSDGSPELIVGVRYTNDADVFCWYDCLVFDVEAGSLVRIDGDIELLSVFLPADGSCFYAETWLQRGTGMVYINQVMIQDGALQSDYVYELFIEDEAYTQFKESNPLVEWTDISDLSGLDDIQ